MAQAGVANFTEQVSKFEIADTPLGQGAMLAVGMGVGDVAKGLVRNFGLPPIATGLVLAWVLTNVKPLRNILGPTTVNLFAAGIIADTLNDQFRLQENTANVVARVFGKRIVSASPPRAFDINRQADSIVANASAVGGMF